CLRLAPICTRGPTLVRERSLPQLVRARGVGWVVLCCVCLRRSGGGASLWLASVFWCERDACATLYAIHSFPSIAWPPPLCPFRKDRSSGCKIVGPPCGAYLLRNSANADPRGRRPGTMLQVSALASMIVTLGSPEMVRRSFAALPWTKPAVPK